MPAGYADGVPRNLGLAGGEVLSAAGAARSSVWSRWTSCSSTSATSPPSVDDEVVLIGRQGDDEITATEWAERLGTISYEIVTGIGARVPRTYTGGST